MQTDTFHQEWCGHGYNSGYGLYHRLSSLWSRNQDREVSSLRNVCEHIPYSTRGSRTIKLTGRNTNSTENNKNPRHSLRKTGDFYAFYPHQKRPKSLVVDTFLLMSPTWDSFLFWFNARFGTLFRFRKRCLHTEIGVYF